MSAKNGLDFDHHPIFSSPALFLRWLLLAARPLVAPLFFCLHFCAHNSVARSFNPTVRYRESLSFVLKYRPMAKVIACFLCTFLLNGFSINAQKLSYLQYHKGFAVIEALIVAEKFESAEKELNDLFGNFEVKFAKDYVVAAQLSIINGHKEKALAHLKNAIKKGVKVECLESVKLIKEGLTDAEWTSIKTEEPPLRKEYLKQLNLSLYQAFHKGYQEEQNAKATPQYNTIVSANFNRIQRLINAGFFPGEDSIGIDNHRFAQSISDCDLGNSRTIVTLLHYDFPISEIGEKKLIDAIENGNLHPREFATVYNFEKNRVSVLYKNSIKKYPELPEYKFNFPFGIKSDDLERVNSDRLKFGICAYEVDLEKGRICQKYGMKLEFGYR